ncbi:hypothetical protein GQ44DRAFT_313151 [Phaeosphaeriaceae sp. PMI808]|nr:hypothetical protein GQ44DRAFT_313151 [Phaeosphaeriaceae sp. PMI808]
MGTGFGWTNQVRHVLLVIGSPTPRIAHWPQRRHYPRFDSQDKQGQRTMFWNRRAAQFLLPYPMRIILSPTTFGLRLDGWHMGACLPGVTGAQSVPFIKDGWSPLDAGFVLPHLYCGQSARTTFRTRHVFGSLSVASAIYTLCFFLLYNLSCINISYHLLSHPGIHATSLHFCCTVFKFTGAILDFCHCFASCYKLFVKPKAHCVSQSQGYHHLPSTP